MHIDHVQLKVLVIDGGLIAVLHCKVKRMELASVVAKQRPVNYSVVVCWENLFWQDNET